MTRPSAHAPDDTAEEEEYVTRLVPGNKNTPYGLTRQGSARPRIDCAPTKRHRKQEQTVEAAASTCFEDLPDELIAKILGKSKVCGCGRLFGEPSELWAHTNLCAWRDGPLRGGSGAADHTLRRLRWLATRACSIRSVDLNGWSGPAADQLFATLTGMLAAGEPTVRVAAHDCEFTSKALDSLLLLPKLECLELGPIAGTVSSAHLGEVLGSLSALSSLDLDFEWCETGSITGGFPEGLLQCTRLRRLHLSNAGDAAFPTLPPAISRLSRLDHLVLYDCGVKQLPEALSTLTNLTRLGVFQFQCPASDVVPLRMPDSITTLKGLRELGLSLPVWRPLLKHMRHLTRLMVRHISSEAEARKFLEGFAFLQPLKTLELCSDTDVATNGKDAFAVVHWAVPDVEFY